MASGWPCEQASAVLRTEQPGTFTHKELQQLAPVLDGFSLMTYDYPNGLQ